MLLRLFHRLCHVPNHTRLSPAHHANYPGSITVGLATPILDKQQNGVFRAEFYASGRDIPFADILQPGYPIALSSGYMTRTPITYLAKAGVV
jgi:hypothetical protein